MCLHQHGKGPRKQKKVSSHINNSCQIFAKRYLLYKWNNFQILLAQEQYFFSMIYLHKLQYLKKGTLWKKKNKSSLKIVLRSNGTQSWLFDIFSVKLWTDLFNCFLNKSRDHPSWNFTQKNL